MYKHILIPTDSSELSEMAIREGVALAKSLGARVTGLTVFPTFHTFALDPMVVTDTPAQYEKDCAALGEKYLGVVETEAKRAGVPVDVVWKTNDHPWEAILETAVERTCDLVFMASHGRKGMSALIIGSETTKVLTHSKIPVLVCR
jgi:nucleotide-binding universal stress UspA family protein